MSIFLRNARPGDRQEVFDVEKKATPGLTYLPAVFDAFATDEAGEFISRGRRRSTCRLREIYASAGRLGLAGNPARDPRKAGARNRHTVLPTLP